ncbi:DUF4267 domain-containing protein [Kineosporia sp. NBRC 101677]|uniref:DUF4267 domain-containing protein n=1 Tax=Kineosporia sp. NBRC 101677 TaxID=3032197 RepID=UPI00332814CD
MQVKSVRDIAAGVVLLVVWADADHTALGWTMIVAAISPSADARDVASPVAAWDRSLVPEPARAGHS